ncbi:MAG: PD40 domain-containing protein [Flavobacteriales bacterium]|nr:PD40 domain-containing protein [Flavobacteriales bacterium]
MHASGKSVNFATLPAKVPETAVCRPIRILLLPLLALLAAPGSAQFYNGSQQRFGKNRVQYREFLWQSYRFPQIETYFYKEGRDVAKYVSISAMRNKQELEKFFDHPIDERLQFVVYNTQSDFRQSNIGLTDDELYNIGGVTRIVGSKVFVYNEGDHALLDRQVRSGIAQVILDQMMFGGNWREVLRNSATMNLPEWFTKGLVGYVSGPWDAASESRLRDAVLGGRYAKFNRLEGRDAELAGQALWSYVADVYGTAVIPNILYMTRVSRNPDSGFMYVLGVPLKELLEECTNHYRTRFLEEERQRDEADLEELAVKTRKARSYSQFKLSPDGRYAAWVSNELGQYKVWLCDLGTRKVKRIAKGEKKIDRIIDTSWPVLAWHPTGSALTWTTERKGELLLNTWTADDRKTVRKPVFMLDKVLDMAYSPDGRNMVFSGVREGRTDLYLYYVIGNRQEQLTNDQWDDLDPAFADGGRSIIFSSNRSDDTLRTATEPLWAPHAKDIFLYDLARRGSVLKRLTDTPGADERQPAMFDSTHYTWLSNAARLQDRWVAHYDSAVSAVDTTIHYRYFTVAARGSNYKRGILEQDVAGQGRMAQLLFNGGKYRFQVGATDRLQSALGQPPAELHEDQAVKPGGAIDHLSAVVKVAVPADSVADAVDIRNYRFSDEGAVPPKAPPGEQSRQEEVPVVGLADSGQDSVLVTKLQYPEQRNYNVNFATDEVLTQLDNSYSSEFYQPLTGAAALNPGLSGLMRMGISDLFEDYKITGGFRLALDLNNNTYMLQFTNLKRRLDKDIILQRQATQGLSNLGVVKLLTHSATYRVSWPFNELTSLRASLSYRHDRYVTQSIDQLSLRVPNASDQTASAKLEYVYDSSRPRGLNLYNGWKAKAFGEYYQQPDGAKTGMQVVGFDIRNGLALHRELTWVNRLAGSASFGSRKVLFFMGGVDNWLFAKTDDSVPIDFTQNYFYQSLAVPMRGFYYNARNGNAFAMANSELRLPVFKYLLNKPLQSDFLRTFQVVAFADAGTAWTGSNPYAEDNFFNRQVIQRNPLTITVRNQREPIIWGYGFGARARLLGYYMRGDWAWGVDDGVVQKGVFQFSLSLDI